MTYIKRITALLASTLLFGAQTSYSQSTTVYTQTLPDGTVVFSDQPQPGSKAIEVKPVATVPALKTDNRASTNQDKAETQKLYSDLTIAAPAHNSAQWSGNGALQVSLSSTTPLLPNHTVSIYVDSALKASGQSMSFTLTEIERGTHSLKATINNASGKQIAATSSTFTLHRPTVNR